MRHFHPALRAGIRRRAASRERWPIGGIRRSVIFEGLRFSEVLLKRGADTEPRKQHYRLPGEQAEATARAGAGLQPDLPLNFPSGLLYGRDARRCPCVFPLAGGRVTAPAHCAPLRVVGRRHFGPRGASGKSTGGPHTCPPAWSGLLGACFGVGVSLAAAAAAFPSAPSGPAVARGPPSPGPRRRRSRRREEGGGPSPPRAARPWTWSITAATSQVGPAGTAEPSAGSERLGAGLPGERRLPRLPRAFAEREAPAGCRAPGTASPGTRFFFPQELRVFRGPGAVRWRWELGCGGLPGLGAGREGCP